MERNASEFNVIRDVTSIVERNKALQAYAKCLLESLTHEDRRVFAIIIARAPISESNLRSHTRIPEEKRSKAVNKLGLLRMVSQKADGKLVVHPTFKAMTDVCEVQR